MNAVKAIGQPVFSQRLHRSARIISSRALESVTARRIFALPHSFQEPIDRSHADLKIEESKNFDVEKTIAAHSR
jgi:hypothetical protein